MAEARLGPAASAAPPEARSLQASHIWAGVTAQTGAAPAPAHLTGWDTSLNHLGPGTHPAWLNALIVPTCRQHCGHPRGFMKMCVRVPPGATLSQAPFHDCPLWTGQGSSALLYGEADVMMTWAPGPWQSSPGRHAVLLTLDDAWSSEGMGPGSSVLHDKPPNRGSFMTLGQQVWLGSVGSFYG